MRVHDRILRGLKLPAEGDRSGRRDQEGASRQAWSSTTKPGGRGDFVVTVDGKLLWDKRQAATTTASPTPTDEILNQLGKA
jgi:hypothetical protein